MESVIFQIQIWATLICGSKSDTDQIFLKCDLSLISHVTEMF